MDELIEFIEKLTVLFKELGKLMIEIISVTGLVMIWLYVITK